MNVTVGCKAYVPSTVCGIPYPPLVTVNDATWSPAAVSTAVAVACISPVFSIATTGGSE